MDEELVARVRKGDLRAFEEIYNTYAGFVFTVALRILQDEEESKEVVQEVFLALYKNITNFMFRSRLKTYIYRIAVNEALSAYRRRKKDKEISGNLPEHLPSADPKRDWETLEIAQKVLDSLPLDYRVILTLREVEGLSYEEISKVLRMRMGTVKSRLSRAKEEFIRRTRELLRREGLHEGERDL